MSGREEEQAGSESSRAAVTTLQTGWLLTDRHVFPTVLEAASLRSGHQRGQVLVRLLLGLQTSPRVLTWQKGLGLCGLSFIRAPISSRGLLQITSQRPYRLHHRPGVRMAACELGGTQTFRPQQAGLWGRVWMVQRLRAWNKWWTFTENSGGWNGNLSGAKRGSASLKVS